MSYAHGTDISKFVTIYCMLHRPSMPAPVQLIKINKHGDLSKYISLKHIFCANDSKEVFIIITYTRHFSC